MGNRLHWSVKKRIKREQEELRPSVRWLVGPVVYVRLRATYFAIAKKGTRSPGHRAIMHTKKEPIHGHRGREGVLVAIRGMSRTEKLCKESSAFGGGCSPHVYAVRLGPEVRDRNADAGASKSRPHHPRTASSARSLSCASLSVLSLYVTHGQINQS